MATASPFNAALRDAVHRLRAATAELERHVDRDVLAENAVELSLRLTKSSRAVLCIGPPGDYGTCFSRRADSRDPLTDPEVAELLESARPAASAPLRGAPPKFSSDSRAVSMVEQLESAGAPIGVLAVGRSHEYDETERHILAVFAAHVASALDSRTARRRQHTLEAALQELRSKLDQREVEDSVTAERLRTAERVERAHELAVQVLLAVSSHAVAGQNLNDFYRRLAQTVGELVGAGKVLFWRLTDANTVTPITGSYGTDEKFMSRLVPARCEPAGDDLASQVVFKDMMFRCNRSDRPAEFDYVLDRLGVESAISVPWRAGQERLGLVAAYDSTRPGGFSREDTWVLQKAGIAAGLVTQLWHTQDDLRKSVDRLSKVDAARQLLLRNMSTVVEKERKRFVSELHDDALQKLTAAEMHVGRLAPDDTVEAGVLDSIIGLLNQTETALRRLVFEVHPPSLEAPDGLAQSVRELMSMLAGTGIKHDLRIDLPKDIDIELRSLIFRQIAEAVGNVQRHSKATSVNVTLIRDDGGILGVVQDDGVGFIVSERSNLPGHLGLLALKERTLMAGGRYKIESRPGAGTRIEFWIPLRS